MSTTLPNRSTSPELALLLVPKPAPASEGPAPTAEGIDVSGESAAPSVEPEPEYLGTD